MHSPYVLAREDTLLGVCEAIGEDFGFNPTYLRVALALLLFWSPIAAVGGYLGAGAVIALSRWIAPNPRPAAEAEAEPVAVPAIAQDENEEPFAVAA